MLTNNNGNNLDALLDNYIENRDNWKLWKMLLQKHDEAVAKINGDTLQKFLDRGVLQDFKKAA